jgi:hydrogenase maturation protease
MTRLTIIGIGNTMMGDDGIGVRVAEALADRDLGPDCEVVVGSVAGMTLIGHFLESETVIVVDGIDVGAEPGSVYRFDADEAGVTSLRSHTSHGLSVPDLVRAARMSGASPQVIVFGIQVGDVSMRIDELSPKVSLALEPTANLVEAEAASHTRSA